MSDGSAFHRDASDSELKARPASYPGTLLGSKPTCTGAFAAVLALKNHIIVLTALAVRSAVAMAELLPSVNQGS